MRHSLHTTFNLVVLAQALALTSAAIGNGQVILQSQLNIAPAGNPEDPHDPSLVGSIDGPDLLSASGIDLAQGLIAAVSYTGGTGNIAGFEAGGLPTVTDGSLSTIYNVDGTANDANDHAAYATIDGTVDGFGNPVLSTSVTFDLGAIFDITQVDVFLGWPDSGRDDSSFELLVSTNGTNFTPVISYAKGGDNTGQFATPVTNLHSITETLGGAIAPAAQFVQLTFTDADNGFAGLAEVDIFGTTPTFDPADADQDGDVDLDDFFLISDNFLQVPSAIGLDGDIVADNIVDAADFRFWKENAPQAVLAQLAALGTVGVPEPSAASILVVAGMLSAGFGRRRAA